MNDNKKIMKTSATQLKLETIEYLKKKSKILFLTTSNRWDGGKEGESPKSTLLANNIAKKVGSSVTVMDVTKLKIVPCEGNVSSKFGNSCGVQKAALKDAEKNPTGHHRCWASINNPDDELWKISKAILESDCVVFFGSVRWGQMNSFYQKLIERLTWLENRHSSLGEENILSGIDAGIIAIGHNWRGKEIIEVQKAVLKFYGFNVCDELCWNWQYTENANDELKSSYESANKEFTKELLS